jgi:hypothetical protein
MNEGIIINKSALKRGFTRADIEWAFLHPIANGVLSEYENKYLHVDFDTKGNPIEIIYNRIDDERINVFHTMSCRKEYIPKDKHFYL